LLACFFGTWAVVDYEGFIATELLEKYDIPDANVGYIFAG